MEEIRCQYEYIRQLKDIRVCVYIIYIYILFLAELLLEQRLIFTRTHMSPLAVRVLQNLQLCCALWQRTLKNLSTLKSFFKVR